MADSKELKDAESAVRGYLTVLRNPESLVDPAEVQRLTEALEASDDPVASLKLRAELRRVQSASDEQYVAGFVAHAKTWAQANGVTAEDFKAEGVPNDVLRDAGLLARTGAARGKRERKPRAKAVDSGAIHHWILSRDHPFTLNDVTAAVGGSVITVRKAVEHLIGEGKVTKIGPDPEHKGRGRSPILYKS